jgi:hypothetical protein
MMIENQSGSVSPVGRRTTTSNRWIGSPRRAIRRTLQSRTQNRLPNGSRDATGSKQRIDDLAGAGPEQSLGSGVPLDDAASRSVTKAGDRGGVDEPRCRMGDSVTSCRRALSEVGMPGHDFRSLSRLFQLPVS